MTTYTDREMLNNWLNGKSGGSIAGPQTIYKKNGNGSNGNGHNGAVHAAPEIIHLEQRAARPARRQACSYQIGREENALTILLFGLGFLVFVIGLCTGLLTVPHGFVAWIGAWVVGFALRSYCGTWVHHDTIDSEAELQY